MYLSNVVLVKRYCGRHTWMVPFLYTDQNKCGRRRCRNVILAPLQPPSHRGVLQIRSYIGKIITRASGGAANCGLRMELIWPNVLMASVNDCLIASFYTLAAFYTLDEARRSISDAKICFMFHWFIIKRLLKGHSILSHHERSLIPSY